MRPAPSVTVLDIGATGHHLGYTPRTIAALAEQGVQVNAFVQANAAAPMARVIEDVWDQPDEPWQRWIAIHPLDPEGSRRSHARRRWIADTARQLATRSDDIIDLMADEFLWGWPATLPQPVRHTHVLHEVVDLHRSSRTARGYAAFPLWMLHAHRSGRHRGRIVVHTPAAKRFLGTVVPLADVVVTPHPAGLRGVAPAPPASVRGRIVFAGSIRSGKGLDLLTESLGLTDAWTELVILSEKVDPAITARLEQLERPARIQLLSGRRYDEALATAWLAVVPYDERFRRKRTGSGVLSDLLRNGVPVVTTPAVRPLLPPFYEGAAVATSTDPAAFARALETAAASREELADAASTHGTAYATGLLDWGTYARRLLGRTEFPPQPPHQPARRVVEPARRSFEVVRYATAPRHRSLHVGWTGHDNLGDEALWSGTRTVLAAIDPIAIEAPQRSQLHSLARKRFRSVVVGGGTLLLERYYLNTVEPSVGAGSPLYVFGTGARTEGIDDEVARRWQPLLRGARYIGVRGERTAAVLADLGVESQVIGDLACLHLDEQQQGRHEPQGVVALNVTGLGRSTTVRSHLATVARMLHERGLELRVLSVSPEDRDDSTYLASVIPQPGIEVVECFRSIDDLRRALHGVDALVGTRLHASALAMAACQVPSVALAYRPKVHEWMGSVGAADSVFDLDTLDPGAVVHRATRYLEDRTSFDDVVLPRIAEFRRLQVEAARRITDDVLGS